MRKLVKESEQLTVVGDQELICSICFDEIKKGDVIREMPTCNHKFHSECVDNWLTVKPQCPNCRKNIRMDIREMLQLPMQ